MEVSIEVRNKVVEVKSKVKGNKETTSSSSREYRQVEKVAGGGVGGIGKYKVISKMGHSVSHCKSDT